MKTTSLQVTAKTMKTILCTHRVQRRSCLSPKAVIRVTSSFYAVEHNAVDKNTTNGDLGDFRSPVRACPSFTNANKMAVYINVSSTILRLYLLYKFQCNNTTVASRIIYIYLHIYISHRNMKPYNKIAKWKQYRGCLGQPLKILEMEDFITLVVTAAKGWDLQE